MAVLFAMYQPPDVIGPLVSQWIDDASNGDAFGLNNLLTNASSNSTPGAYAAVICADGGEFPGPAGAAADYEDALAASATFGTLGEVVRCDLWEGEVEELPELDSSAAPTILVVGNTFDPATPYESAVLLDEQLADSVLLTVDAGGHTAVLDQRCANQIAAAYLNELVTPPADTVCSPPGLYGVQLVNDDNGLLIGEVLAGSAAEAGGVLFNDVVLEVDGQPVSEVADFPVATPGTPSNWLVLRDGEEVMLTVTPDARPWS